MTPVLDLKKQAPPPAPPAAPPPRQSPRPFLWLLIPGLLLVAGFGWWWHSRQAAAPKYQTQIIERGDIQAVISATGSCNAVVTVQVGSQVSGNIKALYADFNTQVKKGQLVALIDPELFQARVTQARANLGVAQSAVVNAQAAVRRSLADVASANANLANQKANVAKANVSVADAKAKLDRRLEMFNRQILSAEDRDTAQAAYDASVAEADATKAQLWAAEESIRAAQAQKEAADAQVQSAQAAVRQSQAMLAQAETDLEHTEIRAPVDGTVIARRMDVGQTVAASFQAPTIFEIAQDLAKMQVDTNVDESDIGRVREGQQATFTVDAYPGVDFHGTVAQIRRAAINVQNVISYDVVVAVSNTEGKLFPGMTASVKILTELREDTLKLPNAALRVRLSAVRTNETATKARPSGGNTVWVLGSDGQPSPIRVRLGPTDGAYSAVEGGDLKEGMAVIVGTGARQNSAPAQTFRGPRI